MDADKALELSGVASQLDMLGPAIFAAIPGDSFPDEKTRRSAAVSLRKSLGKDSLLPAMRQALLEEVSEQKLKEIVDFYSSPLGRKVGKLSGNSLSPDTIQGIMENRYIVSTLSRERLVLVKRIAAAEEAVENNFKLLQSFMRGLVRGYTERSPDEQPLNEDLVKKLQAAYLETRISDDHAREIALVAVAYTFRSLKDDELRRFVELCESDAAVTFRKALQKGLSTAVFETALALGKILASIRRDGEKLGTRRGSP